MHCLFQAGNLLIGPMCAHAIADGVPIHYNTSFVCWVPDVTEAEQGSVFYRWITKLADKAKSDMKKVGVWDRIACELRCRESARALPHAPLPSPPSRYCSPGSVI